MKKFNPYSSEIFARFAKKLMFLQVVCFVIIPAVYFFWTGNDPVPDWLHYSEFAIGTFIVYGIVLYFTYLYLKKKEANDQAD